MCLTDGVERSARAASIRIQATAAGKGKGTLHAGGIDYDIFGLFEQGVFFSDREVATCLHIDDGLLWLGGHEKFNAIVIGAEGLKCCHHKANHTEQSHNGHHWIAGDKFDEIPKCCALMPTGDPTFAPANFNRPHHYR